MKIQPINNNYTNKQVFQTKQPTFGIKIPELENSIDTFLSKPEILNQDKINLLEMIKKFVNKVFNKENFIGCGCYNSVYDMGKYVFRIPRAVKPEAINLSNEIVKNNDNSNLKTYYGAPLLEIGNLQVLKNIGKHTPCGVPFKLIEGMKKEDINQYYFEKYFPLITKVPQEAFDEFAKDVYKIKYGYTIDFYNPNNTVITKDNKIAFTDDLCQSNRYYGENSTMKMLEIFMMDASKGIYIDNYGEHLNEARELFKKIVIAGEKAGLSLLCSQEDSYLLQNILKNCKANIQFIDFNRKIYEIHYGHKPMDVKIKEIEEFIDSIYK